MEQPIVEFCDGDGPIAAPVRAGVRRRLARIEGQVRGIARMVDDPARRCPDLLAQISAVQRALDGVSRQITRNYLERCATEEINRSNPAVYDELMDVIFKYR